MAEESAKLRIPYIAAAQAQKHVTHNEGMTLLDTLVQLSVIDKDLTTPPGSPVEGDTYIVAAGGTGAWIGWDKRIARFIDGMWRSYLPGAGGGAGWLAWVMDEDAMYRFDGTAWALAGIEGPEGPEGPAGPQGDPGPAGAAGADGTDPGILLTWNTGTSDADPGGGKIMANNASLASATFLYISKTNRAGSSIAGKLLSLDDSTSTSRKAGLILTDPATEAQAFFNLSAITDATGYVKAAVSGHSGATSFSNGIAISLQDCRDGDKGADGAGTGDVVGPASSTDGRFALFDGATGKLLKQHSMSATDKLLGRASAGGGGVEEITCTAAARALFDDADAAAMLTTLGAAASGTLNGIQLFIVSGTYIPAGGTTKALVIGQAPGGGGGGVGTTNGTGHGGGGGAGETRMGVFSISGNVSIAIGAVGNGAAAGNNSGGTAGDTTFGALMTCKGGTGGGGSTGATDGSNGSTPTGSGGIRIDPVKAPASATGPGAGGGSSLFGAGGWRRDNTSGGGQPADGRGGAGGGGVDTGTATQTGGAGSGGMIIVIEFR